MKLSIVIPVYNEGENILLTLEEINKIKKHAEITILICYDFDDDNTLSSINNSKFKDILNIIYVKSTEVSGPHAAVMTGINYKKQFDYTIILPADDDYNIKKSKTSTGFCPSSSCSYCHEIICIIFPKRIGSHGDTTFFFINYFEFT